jgi:hypothetical protein
LFEAKVGDGKLMVSSMGLEELQEEYQEAKALRNSILNYMKSDEFNPTFEVSAHSIKKLVVQAESDRRFNAAENSNGGEIVLGENTYTCQGGYDKYYEDRKLELNDGRVDVEASSRSWSDYNKEKNYPDAEITAVFDKEYTVDTIVLYFFEDSGCKAASKVKSFLSVELNMGQMVDDVKLAINCAKPVYFYGRTGGVLMTPQEIVGKLNEIEKGDAKQW